MTDIEDLELTILALQVYPIEPNIIKDMLKKTRNIKEQLTKVSPFEAPVSPTEPTCSNCKHLGKYTDCDICNNKDLRLWNLSNCNINIEEWGCTLFEKK